MARGIPAEELQDELARLSNYVEMALTIARAEQGRLELNSESVELKEFLVDILELFGRLALAEGRQLHWSCPEDVVVQADPNALKQILFNVLTNGMKHGERDIYLRVRARGRCVTLLLGNLPANRSSTRSSGLGIGLRLVQALAGQMQQTHFILRQQRFVWVQLRLPSVKTRPLVNA